MKITFNRTSMESKLNLYGVGGVVGIFLLIEPVWNRNDISTTPYFTEPSFNRTSMESKQILANTNRLGGLTFNRTSMESKQSEVGTFRRILRLLIEPVWNRNSAHQKAQGWVRPSFNRTSMESKLNSCPSSGHKK